ETDAAAPARGLRPRSGRRRGGAGAVCRRGPDCDVKWQRARDWVVAHSRWPIRQNTDTLIATDGPGDTRYAAFVIHRVPSTAAPDVDTIVFAACCTDRVRAFVDHLPARGDRWRNVTDPKAQYRVRACGGRAGGELRQLRRRARRRAGTLSGSFPDRGARRL